MENQTAQTTDSWSWGKIVKHVLLPKPKGSPKAGKKEISVRIGMATVFGLIAFNLFFGGKSIPTCDQKETTDLVHQIITRHPFMMMMIKEGKMEISLRNIREEGYNKVSEVRFCVASIQFNGSELDAFANIYGYGKPGGSFQYSVYWEDKKQGIFGVEGRGVR
jgi:hypothetical protein